MTRIKIRTTTIETPETRAFKLGYQKGFREAESVTLERIQRENIDPLNEKLYQAERELYHREQEINKLKHELQITQTRIKYLEGKESKKFYEHKPEVQKFLGFDMAINEDYSGGMTLVNTDYSSLEDRITARYSETLNDQMLRILRGLPSD